MKITELFRRQLDLVKPSELDFPIAVIGAGGIGSWTTLALAKMGCEDITVFDFDALEAKNIPSQFYKLDQIGQQKVTALHDNVAEFTGVDIKTFNIKYQDALQQDLSFTTVINAVDSLEQRSLIWHLLFDRWLQYRDMQCYVDARMGGELLRILVVNPFDQHSVELYEKKLYPSKKPSKEPCTAKSIVYNTFFCGGAVASIVKKFAKKEDTVYDFIFDITQSVSY